MSYLEKINDIYSLIGQGKSMDAFEKYYADNVVMVEGDGVTTEGKDANRQREAEFFSTLEDMHGGGATAITVDEDKGVTMVEAWMDATFKGGMRMKMEQVAVQRWEGDQIVHERFYYNAPS